MRQIRPWRPLVLWLAPSIAAHITMSSKTRSRLELGWSVPAGGSFPCLDTVRCR